MGHKLRRSLPTDNGSSDVRYSGGPSSERTGTCFNRFFLSSYGDADALLNLQGVGVSAPAANHLASSVLREQPPPQFPRYGVQNVPPDSRGCADVRRGHRM